MARDSTTAVAVRVLIRVMGAYHVLSLLLDFPQPRSSSSPTIRSSSTLVILDVFAIYERKISACFFLCSFVGRECPDARKAASCCGYGLIVVLAGHKRSRPPAPTQKKIV